MSERPASQPANRSEQPSLEQLVERRFSRRQLIGGALSFAAVASLPRTAAAAGVADTAKATTRTAGKSTLMFDEVDNHIRDAHQVSPGYTADVLIRWGDPTVGKDAPDFDPDRQTGAAQEKQFGAHNDFIAFMPLPRGSKNSDHGLLCVNHEYTSGELMWRGVHPVLLDAEQTKVEMAAQGHSITEIRKVDGHWTFVRGSNFNRRFTANTPIDIGGPARGHGRMKTSADPTGTRVLGTFANCCGGTTPWGTVLSAEENFQDYFAGRPGRDADLNSLRRYGLGAPGYGWARHVERFRLDRDSQEPNRFGWIVEIDPYDPTATPIKRTALGRFRHEGACVTLTSDNRVVVYSGDDQAYEYVYRFVSNGRFDPDNPRANLDLLDDGTLYVARFDASGKGEWLPLVHGQGPLTSKNGFHCQADVVIDARLAADAVGATPMDRPEDIAVHPHTGKVYVALTKNSTRSADRVDAANPRAAVPGGHILEIEPPEVDGSRDHAAQALEWNILLLAGDPNIEEHETRYHPDTSHNGWFYAPDNLEFDAKGRLWISTDQGSDQVLHGVPDGIRACDTEGEGRALTKLFFACPPGAEACGPCFTPDDKTLFVAVQHPGEGWTLDNPRTLWPDYQAGMPPRSAVVAITKDDGSVIGD